MINIGMLVNETECYRMIREMRWKSEIKCVYCGSAEVKKDGQAKENCQKYKCKKCARYFDDVTGTIFAGRHQSVKKWVICLYFMGLNLSNAQIAQELDMCESDVQAMTTELREGIESKAEPIQLSGEVEMDEVYITAGHRGNTEAVKKNIGAAEETD